MRSSVGSNRRGGGLDQTPLTPVRWPFGLQVSRPSRQRNYTGHAVLIVSLRHYARLNRVRSKGVPESEPGRRPIEDSRPERFCEIHVICERRGPQVSHRRLINRQYHLAEVVDDLHRDLALDSHTL